MSKTKEKADELIERFHKDYGEKNPDGTFTLCIVSIGRAKQCAIICVDEIIDTMNDDHGIRSKQIFCEEVKNELNKEV